jgi:hypothetical protein
MLAKQRPIRGFRSTNHISPRGIVIWLPKKRVFDERSSVSLKQLQSAITEAVKKADPACEAFAGVVVQRETTKSRQDANWTIKGIRFGRADRDKSSQALATIVQRMQREFSLVLEDGADPPKGMASKS